MVSRQTVKKVYFVNSDIDNSAEDEILITQEDPEKLTLVRIILDLSISFYPGVAAFTGCRWRLAVQPSGTSVVSALTMTEADYGYCEDELIAEGGLAHTEHNFTAAELQSGDSQQLYRDISSMRILGRDDNLVFSHIGSDNTCARIIGSITTIYKLS